MNFRVIATIVAAWGKLSEIDRESIITLLGFNKSADVLNPRHSLTETEVALCDCGRKIPAIKSVRNRLGLGLKEAKDMVEKLHSCPPQQYYCPPLGIYDGNELPRWVAEAKDRHEGRHQHRSMYDGMTDDELSS